jgi:hypothetical protein
MPHEDGSSEDNFDPNDKPIEPFLSTTVNLRLKLERFTHSEFLEIWNKVVSNGRFHHRPLSTEEYQSLPKMMALLNYDIEMGENDNEEMNNESPSKKFKVTSSVEIDSSAPHPRLC